MSFAVTIVQPGAVGEVLCVILAFGSGLDDHSNGTKYLQRQLHDPNLDIRTFHNRIASNDSPIHSYSACWSLGYGPRDSCGRRALQDGCTTGR